MFQGYDAIKALPKVGVRVADLLIWRRRMIPFTLGDRLNGPKRRGLPNSGPALATPPAYTFDVLTTASEYAKNDIANTTACRMRTRRAVRTI